MAETADPAKAEALYRSDAGLSLDALAWLWPVVDDATIKGEIARTILKDAVRELVSEALQTQGYKVLTATRGDQALKIAGRREQKIDLMVTDVVMPGMSGRELAKLILQGRPQARVLFLSGYTEDAVLHQGALDTGTAFLQKPFTLDALACKVREILDA